MHHIALFCGVVFILYGKKHANTEIDTPISISQKLSHFANLIDVVGHCSFVSIQSYQESTCKLRHKESFCNKFTKIVQQQYGSNILSFTANSTFSFGNVDVSRLPLAKRMASRCTVWIQYEMVPMPFEFTRLEPDIFIFYSNLDKLQYEFQTNSQIYENKAYWLQAIESWFAKPMVIIHANPYSTGIRIWCMYCRSLEIIAMPVDFNHIVQTSNSIAFLFNHERARRNLHMSYIFSANGFCSIAICKIGQQLLLPVSC